jgi:A/G-specific adenine glycosylase
LFAERVLTWFASAGRHDLPWQRDPAPYRVWVSEIMLQQTQTAVVVRYFERFMQRFPDVAALADAPLDEVLHLWSGLGYYARARNLHRSACAIGARHGGKFPRDYAAVAALPGIGRSTAGAIMALAHGERRPILDGNVKRVLARFHAVSGWPGQTYIANTLWGLAERHTPQEHVAAYTQAMMDLGATVCTRRRPACGLCPLAADCQAHRLGRELDFPAPRPKRAMPVRVTRMLIVRYDRQVLLQRRPPVGVWGGLWSFPEIGGDDDPIDWCRREFGVPPIGSEHGAILRHTFSHFHLDIEPVWLELAEAPMRVADRGDWHWYDMAYPPRIGLAAPVAKLLKR